MIAPIILAALSLTGATRHMVLVYGQSLCTGADGGAARSTAVYGTDSTYYYNTLTWPGNTLREGVPVNIELPRTGIGMAYRTLGGLDGLVIHAGCVGGQSYAQLAQGTANYNQILARVQDGVTAGDTVIVDGVVWVHGQANVGDSAATYLGHLIELQGDLDADIKAITGQSADVVLFMDQPANIPGPALAQYQAASNDPDHFVLCGPEYPSKANQNSTGHLYAEWYTQIGERCGRALYAHRTSGDTAPTWPTAIRKYNTSRLAITFHVRTPPLVFDWGAGAQTGAGPQGGEAVWMKPCWGFTITGRACIGAAILSDGVTVVLTTDGTISDTAVVSYAYAAARVAVNSDEIDAQLGNLHGQRLSAWSETWPDDWMVVWSESLTGGVWTR